MNKKYTFYVEITTACNLKCPFCPSSNLNNHRYMSFDNYKKIIDSIKDYANLVYFHVLGEPSLHKDLSLMFDYCENLKIPFAITTNGINLNKLSNFIFNYNYLKKINISLQALIQLNENQRNEYIQNLISFIDKRNNLNSIIPLNLRLWNDKNSLDVIILNSHVKNKLNIIVDNNKNIVVQEADEFIWPSLEHEVNKYQSSCLGGKKQFAILNDGRVVLCCLDYLGSTSLGNLFVDDFTTILNSKLYCDIMKAFNNRKPYFELCQKCTFRNRF